MRNQPRRSRLVLRGPRCVFRGTGPFLKGTGEDPTSPWPRAPVAALFILALACSDPTQAQTETPYTRVEAGIQTSLLGASFENSRDIDFGFGGRFTYNFSKNIALDTQLEFYPRRDPGLPGTSAFQEGGRRLVGLAGLRAGFRRRRFGLFGKVRPGAITFGSVPRATGTGSDRITHFALDLGGVLEVYPTKRVILRIDVGQLLTRYGERTTPLGPGAFLIAPGLVTSFGQFSAGISYRVGSFQNPETPPEAEAASAPRRFEVGGQFGWLGIEDSPPTFSLRDEPGYGGRFTYNLYRWLGFDARFTYFYRNPQSAGTQEGGKILQCFFGPKAGIRENKVGVFAKFEPGLTRYGQTLSDFRNFPQSVPYQRQTYFSFDTGAVLEYYASVRTVLRFDVGEVAVFVGPTTVFPLFGSGPVVEPGYTKTGLAISTGLAWRF